MIPYEQVPKTFGRLLDWHLHNGTRPAGDPHADAEIPVSWTNADFGEKVAKNLKKEQFSERSVRNWRSGTLPKNIITVKYILDTLFGENPTGDRLRWCGDLRTAYNDVMRQNTEETSSNNGAGNSPLNISSIAINRASIEVSVHAGLFYDGGHHSEEFDDFCGEFLQRCFNVGFHNTWSFHVGGNFSIVKYWQVPVFHAEEVAKISAEVLLAFGITCDPPIVEARNDTDGRPSITLIVGKAELLKLRDAASPEIKKPSFLI